MFSQVGCDIVSISRFAVSLQRGGENFVEHLFSPSEYLGSTLEHLAGIFAAKEATCKALKIPSGHWRALYVTYQEDGAPQIIVDLPEGRFSEIPLTISISHDDDYAFAVAIAIYPKT